MECPDYDRQMNRSFLYYHKKESIYVEFWCICGARFVGHVYRVKKKTEEKKKERRTAIPRKY